MSNTCVIPVAIEAGWEGMTEFFRNCSDDLVEKYQGLGEFKGVGPDSGWQGLATYCCGFHEQNFPNLVDEAAKYLRAAPYESQAATDAARAAYGGPRYWAYLDKKAKEHAARFPTRGTEFMEQSLGEALAGNEGD